MFFKKKREFKRRTCRKVEALYRRVADLALTVEYLKGQIGSGTVSAKTILQRQNEEIVSAKQILDEWLNGKEENDE